MVLYIELGTQSLAVLNPLELDWLGMNRCFFILHFLDVLIVRVKLCAFH